MDLDLNSLASSAHKQVDKLGPKGDEDRPKPQVEVLESAAIVVAVVCLALAAEYLVTSVLALVGLGAGASALPDAAARLASDRAAVAALNATVQELNGTAEALSRSLADALQQNAVLTTAVAQLAALGRDLFVQRRRRVTVVCDAAPARMHELHSNSNRESQWLYYQFIQQDCTVVRRDTFDNSQGHGGTGPDWSTLLAVSRTASPTAGDADSPGEVVGKEGGGASAAGAVPPSKPRRERRGAAAGKNPAVTYEVGEHVLPSSDWACTGAFERMYSGGGFAGGVVLVPGQPSALHAATLERTPVDGPGFGFVCLDYAPQKDRCSVWSGSAVARVLYTCDMPEATALP